MQDASKGLFAHADARDDSLAMPTPDEVLRTGLLVAAHIGLEQHPRRLEPSGSLQARQHKLMIERERVTGDHVRSARLPGRVPIEHVAGGPKYMGVHLPEAGVPAQSSHPGDPLLRQRIGWIVEPGPHRLNVCGDPPRAQHRRLGGFEEQACGPGDAIVEHKRLHAAAVEYGGDTTLHRRGQATFRMRQRDVDLLGHARVFDQVPVGRIDVVGAQVQSQRPDDRYG